MGVSEDGERGGVETGGGVVEGEVETHLRGARQRFAEEIARREGDLVELRELVRAWRDAKTSAWKALVDWVVRGALALLLIGIAVRLGAWNRL